MGSVYVTAGTDRRSSGTHYTPRSLTEPIVQYTLEPLVYDGPAAGKPKEEWKLHSAKDLLNLKICDMACGSGAFLVQACRYLSERLLEAWENEAQNTTNHRVTENTENTEAFNSNSSSVSSVPLWFKSDNEDERITLSRRLVVQRCLYGVDKNPLAAEMAKLSLWLLTLAKDRPFTFLDHAIRCGDSLVGIHDLKQLENLTLTGAEQYGRVWLESLQTSIRQAKELRQKIETMSANDAQAVAEQEALHKDAERLTAKLRAVADLLIADAINGEDRGVVMVAARFRESTAEAMQDDANKLLKGQRTFHWPLEFPEVMLDRGGFDAFVCNPPFMGGQKITGTLGDSYREYLVGRLAEGRRGSADLCAYFFLRATPLLRDGGQLGFLATNTIAQGDTREVCLEQLTSKGCTIPRAVASRVWPGGATVYYAAVWMRRGQWNGTYVLDDQPTNGITAFLSAPGAVTGNPYCLKANEGKSFQGSIVLGMGFVLEPEQAQLLIDKNATNEDVLFPYLNGEDLNSSPNQSPNRWVINFFDWPIERAMQYSDCFRIIEEKVKPERMSLRDTADGKRLKKRWWLFCRNRAEMYAAIAGMERVLVLSRITNYVQFSFVSPRQVFSDRLAVFPLADMSSFSVLSSSFHYVWSWNYSVTNLSLLSYAPSDCFETFPFPVQLTALDAIGGRCHDHRSQIMLTRQEGLTATYNRFHDPDECSADIQKLRQLHVEMDHAVAAAYGWTDLDLGHGFHETRQGVRYTIRDAARREVLGHLLQLNHERYAAEVKQGLHDQKKARSKPRNTRKTRKKNEEGGGLFE